MGADDLAPWFRGKSRVVVAKGKKFHEHALKGLKAEEKAKLVLGPTGNLRAPTLVVGDTLLVGFHEEAYESEL